MAERHDRTPDVTQSTAYCTTRPVPGTYLSDLCADCGHAGVLHLGTAHCPVCELVDLNAKARAASSRVEVHVQGEPLTEEKLRAAIRRRPQYPH